tara:strand:+ start:4210 stop:4701 length:492 start_codon:yes stop_codon:yes gene_type:complete
MNPYSALRLSAHTTTKPSGHDHSQPAGSQQGAHDGAAGLQIPVIVCHYMADRVVRRTVVMVRGLLVLGRFAVVLLVVQVPEMVLSCFVHMFISVLFVYYGVVFWRSVLFACRVVFMLLMAGCLPVMLLMPFPEVAFSGVSAVVVAMLMLGDSALPPFFVMLWL